jgi:hypothetical protein
LGKLPVKTHPYKTRDTYKIQTLKGIIKEKNPRLLKSELNRAKKCVDYLENGGPSFQSRKLKGCNVKNSKAALKFGKEVTDTIADWITKDFVAGPFCNPPVSEFRANSILAITQANKTRICINVSLPEGKSLNDNVDSLALEKITMSSAKNFGFSVIKCGKDSIFAKTDIVDAYKNVPAKIEDLHLQGFRWENKFFLELRQMFGASSSVQNFDILGNTITSLAKVGCGIPSHLIHRQLDDTPVIAPKNSGWCEEFYNSYKNICEKINLQLAPECPDLDKSFGPTTKGKVLGIWFNTKTTSWKLPEDKRLKTVAALKETLHSKELETTKIQSLLGRLNFVSSMCPFLTTFKYNLNTSLSSLLNGYKTFNNTNVKNDLITWLNFLKKEDQWMPICPERHTPPLSTLLFTTDAAGCPDNTSWTDDIGCGVVGLDADENTILGFQMWWPKSFITSKTDNKGIRFGNKSTTLESINILLPFLLIPEKLKNTHVQVFTDNIACVYGMKDGYVKRDEYPSIFIRAITLISGYLGTVVHTSHTPRRSN